MKDKESNSWRPQDADKDLIKQQIRDRVRNAKLGDNAVLIPAKPTPTINDSDHKVVAVYARVSTKSTEQVSSIENQTKYYSEKVEKTPNWTLQEIYSDEGKSGTSMRKRTEFQRMLRDAKDKKMDLILCASVSRFARNVSECIEQVDELRTQNPSHPVGVYFETENIYTLDESSSQTLDMHAMVADWESANKSRRMIISYDQRICMGQYPVADLLGYRHTKDGQLIVQEEEAKTVRFIFLSYINGSSLEEIAQVLTEKKRPTLRGRTEWNAAMVQSIMTNERRWGDLHARKRVVISYKKGKTAKNNRIRDAAFVTGHHEAIVSPAIAKAAKMIMASGCHYDGGITDVAVIQSGALKGFISISPVWAGINNEALLQIYSDSIGLQNDLMTLCSKGILLLDGDKVSTAHIASCETTAALHLSEILQNNMIERPIPFMSIVVNGHELSAEQRRAISVSLSHRLSLIIGGAGTGKTSLIQGIFQMYNKSNNSYVAAAPTGKAAVNIRMRCGVPSMTVHSLLGLGLELTDDRVNWNTIGLIVIDEAGMLTIEMLSGILSHCRSDCRIILVGDNNQLQSVGAGNVMSDLVELGFPVIQLFENHRQKENHYALSKNIQNFSWISGINDIDFDDSFLLIDTPEHNMQRFICEKASEQYINNKSFQLLSPVNNSGNLSVSSLNNALHSLVNPCVDKSDIQKSI